jgi:hypothetical protein
MKLTGLTTNLPVDESDKIIERSVVHDTSHSNKRGSISVPSPGRVRKAWTQVAK